jgi:hypothetical protein
MVQPKFKCLYNYLNVNKVDVSVPYPKETSLINSANEGLTYDHI